MCAILASAGSGRAQSTVQTASFTPASQVLFATDFTQDVLGSFPKSLEYIRGPVDIVTNNGVRMLRAIGPSEFRIRLAQPVPVDFTLEFDFVARTGAGHQIAFEGGPVALPDDFTYAEILWNPQIATIMGGGERMTQVTLPSTLQSQIWGKPTKVQVAMSGTQFKLFTNGIQIHSLPALAFNRVSVLRIFIGGLADAPLYLAGIRLATNGPSNVATGGAAASSSGTATGTPRTGGTILSGGPTSKIPLTIIPPPSLSTAPAPYNQPTQLLPVQSSQSMTMSQTPVATPVATPFTPGPTDLAGASWPPGSAFMTEGVGVAVIWTPVAGAASYRVYRTALGSPLPAQPHFWVTEAEAAAIAHDHSGSGWDCCRMIVDPFIMTANVYWVDAIFADGTISGLSPSYTLVPPPPTPALGLVKNLKATFGPTTNVVTWDGKISAPGRTVSWTWDPLLSAVIYELHAFFFVQGSAVVPVSPYTETILASRAPLVLGPKGPVPAPAVQVPLSHRGLRRGPPFLMGVPTGIGVLFCVALVRDPSSAAGPPPPQVANCLSSFVP